MGKVCRILTLYNNLPNVSEDAGGYKEWDAACSNQWLMLNLFLIFLEALGFLVVPTTKSQEGPEFDGWAHTFHTQVVY